MPTNVYIDGFNLYYGAIKGTDLHWLNIEKMCRLLLPEFEIGEIGYFTAIVKGWAGDPEKPLRQRTYLRALATLSSVVVTEGVFLTHPVCMRLAHPRAAGPKYAWVVKTEEKGSDVNIATHLIHDAHRNRYDTAVVISNDSDLLRPIQIVRREFNKKVGIVNPRDQRPIRILRDESDFQKTLRTGLLRESQFPDVMSDARGEFTNPFIFHRTETRVRPTPPL